MKRRDAIVIVVSLVLVLCLMAGCKESNEGVKTSLRIALVEAPMAKTLMPTTKLMEVSRYSVCGTGPNGEAFGPIEDQSNVITVTEIVSGLWTIEAKALNSEGNEVCSGSGNFELRRGANDVTIQLDTMAGNGSLQLNLLWDTDITAHKNVSLNIQVKNKDGATIASDVKEVQTSMGGTVVNMTLPAGSHVLTVRLSDTDGDLQAGATDAVRIMANTTTMGAIKLQATKYNASVDVKIEDTVGRPMNFYLDYNPKDTSVGAHVTLEAKCDALPQGVTKSDLTYTWYVDGYQKKQGGNGTYTIEVPAGVHRYDVIVDCTKLKGAMCGASLIINSGSKVN